jgi:hypothetical protein
MIVHVEHETIFKEMEKPLTPHKLMWNMAKWWLEI